MERVKKYVEDVLSDKIVTCQATKWAMQRFVDDLGRPEFIYRTERVQSVLDFMDDLTIYKGPAAGKPMIVEPYYAFKIANQWGFWWRETDARRFRYSFTFVGRKNVKSMSEAAEAIVAVRFDYEAGADVYNCATNFDQANESYIKAFHLANTGRKNPDGSWHASLIERGYFKKPISTEPRALIGINEHGEEVGRYRPLAHTPKKHDGRDPSHTIIEEYHAHTTADFVEVMKTGMGARPDSMLDIITTAGGDIDGPCYAEYEYAKDVIDPSKPDVQDDSYLTLIYELDEGDDWKDEKNWPKPNPCLGTVKRIEDMRDQFGPAKRNAKKRAEFKTKHLNVWGVQEDAHFSEETIEANFGEPIDLTLLKGKVAAVAVDAGMTRDLTCMGFMFKDALGQGRTEYLLASFVPEGALRLDKKNSDKYLEWSKEDFLTVTKGKMSDHSELTKKLLWARDEIGIIISQVQYDPTFLQDWAEEMELRGFNMVVFYQTYGNYTQPCIRMENKMEQTADEDVENVVGSYNCLGNPMWRWMARNYREKYQGDRRMPAKPNNPGSVRKIDGMVTFVICEDGLMDIPDKPPVSPEPTFI